MTGEAKQSRQWSLSKAQRPWPGANMPPTAPVVSLQQCFSFWPHLPQKPRSPLLLTWPQLYGVGPAIPAESDYSVAGLTATVPDDVLAKSGTLVFTAGDATKQVVVDVAGDTTAETPAWTAGVSREEIVIALRHEPIPPIAYALQLLSPTRICGRLAHQDLADLVIIAGHLESKNTPWFHE